MALVKSKEESISDSQHEQQILILDPITGGVVTTETFIGPWSSEMRISRDGQEIGFIYSENGEDVIGRVNKETGELQTLKIKNMERLTGMAYAPDNDIFVNGLVKADYDMREGETTAEYIQRARGRLTRVTPDGQEKVVIDFPGFYGFHVNVSPDGSRVVVEDFRSVHGKIAREKLEAQGYRVPQSIYPGSTFVVVDLETLKKGVQPATQGFQLLRGHKLEGAYWGSNSVYKYLDEPSDNVIEIDVKANEADWHFGAAITANKVEIKNNKIVIQANDEAWAISLRSADLPVMAEILKRMDREDRAVFRLEQGGIMIAGTAAGNGRDTTAGTILRNVKIEKLK